MLNAFTIWLLYIYIHHVKLVKPGLDLIVTTNVNLSVCYLRKRAQFKTTHKTSTLNLRAHQSPNSYLVWEALGQLPEQVFNFRRLPHRSVPTQVYSFYPGPKIWRLSVHVMWMRWITGKVVDKWSLRLLVLLDCVWLICLFVLGVCGYVFCWVWGYGKLRNLRWMCYWPLWLLRVWGEGWVGEERGRVGIWVRKYIVVWDVRWVRMFLWIRKVHFFRSESKKKRKLMNVESTCPNYICVPYSFAN